MRIRRALAVAAVVVIPAALVIVPATRSSAQPATVCGAITKHPLCPGVDNGSNSVPTFPYTTGAIGSGSPQ